MKIDYENDEIEKFIRYGIAKKHPFKDFKSNAQLRKDIDRVMRMLEQAECCKDLYYFQSLNYEPLKYGLRGLSSVRLGYKTKFRLLFEEHDYGVRICIIEISEHYGDK